MDFMREATHFMAVRARYLADKLDSYRVVNDSAG